MKKFFAAALLLVIVAVAACDTLDERFVFYINENEELRLTPELPAGKMLELDTITIITNADTTFERNRTRAAFVQEITLDKFNLSITDSTKQDFDFLESADVYMSADGLDEVRVAFIENIPANDSTLNYSVNLNRTNTRLDEYLKKEAYTIHTRLVLREKVDTVLNVVTTIRFKVIADPF